MRFQVGDMVTAPKFPVTHYGIVTSTWPLRIAHQSKAYGRLVETDARGFAGDETITLAERAPVGAGHSIAARMRSGLGRPYRLFADNCEHAARAAFSGAAVSFQMMAWGAVGVLTVTAGVCVVAAVVLTPKRPLRR